MYTPEPGGWGRRSPKLECVVAVVVVVVVAAAAAAAAAALNTVPYFEGL